MALKPSVMATEEEADLRPGKRHCPACPAGRLVRFGTRTLSALTLGQDGRAVRAPHEVQRWRCKVCGHAFAERPDRVVVRDAVVESAMRYGFAEASNIHGIDVRTVSRMMRDWTEVRESELGCEIPDVIDVATMPSALGLRLIVSSPQDGAILDVLEGPEALVGYASARAGIPSLAAIDVDPAVARTVALVWPNVVTAVPPALAAHAILKAAAISFRALVRASVAKGRNFREDPRLLGVLDQDLTEVDRDELSFWATDLRRFRAAVGLLLRDLDAADQATFSDSLTRVRRLVGNIAPGGALDSMLSFWGDALCAGNKHRWLDEPREAVESLRSEVMRLKPSAAFDTLRAILVFSVPIETPFDPSLTLGPVATGGFRPLIGAIDNLRSFSMA